MAYGVWPATSYSSAWYWRLACKLELTMCRSIKTLFNYDPPATDDEIRAASVQFVRKICGSTHPSRANEAAFTKAVDAVFAASRELLSELVSKAEPKNREVEAAKARARNIKRFGRALHD